MNILGEVEGKTAVIIDDMIDTAGSICNAAKALVEIGGAKDPSVDVTLSCGVFSVCFPFAVTSQCLWYKFQYSQFNTDLHFSLTLW